MSALDPVSCEPARQNVPATARRSESPEAGRRKPSMRRRFLSMSPGRRFRSLCKASSSDSEAERRPSNSSTCSSSSFSSRGSRGSFTAVLATLMPRPDAIEEGGDECFSPRQIQGPGLHGAERMRRKDLKFDQYKRYLSNAERQLALSREVKRRPGNAKARRAYAESLGARDVLELQRARFADRR